MRIEAFVAPGQGASDALMDWLELHELTPILRDVRRDEEALAEAVALGAGRLPVVRAGDRIALGFDPSRLERLLRRGDEVGDGVRVELDESGLVTVTEIRQGSPAESSGLLAGDVIVQVGGYSAFTIDQLRAVLARPSGRRLQLKVRRQGDLVDLSLPVPVAAA